MIHRLIHATLRLFKKNKTVYYISSNGKDLPSHGFTPQKPFKTIKYAERMTSRGDEVKVEGGVYSRFFDDAGSGYR
jgi:hypothetical protein